MTRSSGRHNASKSKVLSSSGEPLGSTGTVEHDRAPTDDDETSESGDDDDDFEPGKIKRPTGTKRKRAGRKSATQGQPSTKKMRKKRGSLRDILEMNVDILYEIFGHLDPLDLLHLAWASKMTREFLMSKSSQSLWKSARSNIPGLPDCPDDLSEPQYANLMFGKSCHACLRNLNSLDFVFEARVRMCKKCMEERFLPERNNSLYNLRHMSKMFSYVPTMWKEGRVGRFSMCTDNVTEQKWKEAYGAAENKEEWVRAEFEKRKKIRAHAEKCEEWNFKYQTHLENEKNAATMSRVKDLERRIGEMGWAAEIEDMKSRGKSITDEKPSILKLCRKEITERVFQSLLPSLEKVMQDYNERRQNQKLAETIEGRIPDLAEVVKTYKSAIRPDVVALDIGDIFSHPEVMEVMVKPLDVWDPTLLDPIRARLPDIVQELQAGIEKNLIAMIQSACGESAPILDPRAVFNLATTTFQCILCNISRPSEVIRYPRVLVHACATKYPDRTDEPMETRTLGLSTGKARWNSRQFIGFDAEAQRILSEVVVRYGLDPATTSAARMNEADPIFECLACNDLRIGKFVLRWNAVPAHLKQKHKISSLKESTLQLLQENEARSVRIRMDDDVARQRAQLGYTGVVCTRCSRSGNSVDIRKHVNADHQVPNPSEDAGDYVVRLDAPTIVDTYYSWPPRNEFDHAKAPTEPTNANN